MTTDDDGWKAYQAQVAKLPKSERAKLANITREQYRVLMKEIRLFLEGRLQKQGKDQSTPKLVED